MKKKHIMQWILVLMITIMSFTSAMGATLNLTAEWNANTETDLREYRLYRTDGSKRELIERIYHPNTYCDFSVDIPDGFSGILSFILTAVDTDDNQSSDSNVALYRYFIYTVTTNPPGLQIVVDNHEPPYTAPHAVHWTVGSNHTLSAPSFQSGISGVQYLFASWSDRKSQTHTVTAPSSNTTYTANFTTQYSLTSSVNLSEGGTVNPSGTFWFNSGQRVSVSARPNPGYVFTGWSGDLSGTTSRKTLIMDGLRNIVANFKQKPYIRVTSPNGGEAWVVGTEHTISWESGSLDEAGTIYLFYWYDNAWHTIAALSPPTTSFPWTIPRVPEGMTSPNPSSRSRSTKIWIGNWVNGNWECYDSSDQSFRILYDAWVCKISGGDQGGATLLFDDGKFEGYGITLGFKMFKVQGVYGVDAQGAMSGTYEISDFNDPEIVLDSGSFTGSVDSKSKKLTLNFIPSDGSPVFSMSGIRFLTDPVIPGDWTGTLSGSTQGTLDSLKIKPYQPGDDPYSYVFEFSGSGSIEGGFLDIKGNFYLTSTTISYFNRTNVYGIYGITGAFSETGVLTGSLNPTSGTISFSMTSDDGKNNYTLTGEKKVTP